jgi:tricorn protease
MLQARGRLDLAQEALAHAGEVEVLGVDQLERDEPAERLLPREVDDAHPAAAEPLEQPEVPELFRKGIHAGVSCPGSHSRERPEGRVMSRHLVASSRAFASFVLLCFAPLAAARSASDETLLLRDPAVSADAIVFAHAGDLWSVGLDGGEASRLTVHPGVESGPVFSPDGTLVAFSGQYEGNLDVYVVPARGGDPRRLTFHPGPDVALGFTPDSKKVLFASRRASDSTRYSRFFTVPVEGGFEELLSPPMAERGCFSPDGKKLAYTPIADAFRTWKRYRGGMTTPIWLFDLATNAVEEIPHENASDTSPRWIGDTVFFLSDRAGTMNLFAYEPRSHGVRQVTFHDDFDVKSFSGCGDRIVYEQAGRLNVLDARAGRGEPPTRWGKPLSIRIDADLPDTRRHFEPALPFLRDAGLSPTGVRAVFEARGDVFTVPAKKGDVRNLTRTPGAHERSPAWSPDGKTIACLSDASGEYELLLYPQDRLTEPRHVKLGDAPSFYYSPRWSPDGRHIAYTDKRLNLWCLDVESGASTKVDTDLYDHPVRSLDPAWSPDGKWIAYTRRLPNHFRAVFLYELSSGKATEITNGRSDASSACFTLDGKHLCFLASTNYGLNVGWLDMSSYERPVRSSVYVVVLDKDAPSPLQPESDEEAVAAAKDEKKADEKKDGGADAKEGADAKKDGDVAKKDGDAKKDDATKEGAAKPRELPTVKIDLDNIDQRILALPIPAKNWAALQAAADGKLFLVEIPDQAIADDEDGGGGASLERFDFKERKLEPFLANLGRGYWLSADGKKLLYATGKPGSEAFGIVDSGGTAKPGDGALDLSRMQADVDPHAEWKEMFDEVVRLERDFFYVKNLHGADWPAIADKYRPFLPHVGHRADLAYLFSELIGELVIGHAYVYGGDFPETKGAAAGLLGCDFAVEGGRYRVKSILSGENWNPDLFAPLTQPGVKATVGDYLLAVDGRELLPPTNVHEALLGTAGKQTVLKLGKAPDDPNAWTTTVVPVPDESGLRRRAWIERNRRKVDELSHGRVAYIYMPNTAGEGYVGFNRDYYASLDKEGVVIDERFNGGGSVADYVIDMLRRPLLSMWATREGREFPTPAGSIFGPKAMIINEYAGSGGDAMPHFFRRAGLGKLVGRRTWGGLVGIYDYPPLLDGGTVTAPRLAIYSPDGQWEVENTGVPPDVDVVMTPKDVIAGHDPQLEKAVEVVMQELAAKPVKLPARPMDPVRVR